MNFRTVTDLLWPTLEPAAPDEPARLAKIQSDYVSEHDATTHGDVVAAEQWYLDEVEAYKAEQARGQGALERLKVFLTVAPTLTILPVLAGWALSDAFVELTYWSKIALLIVAAYVALQVVLTLWWANGALGARIVEPLPVSVQQTGQSREAYFREKAAAVYLATCANTEENNYLISCRLVIKACVRNFVVGALACVTFAVIAVTYNSVIAEADAAKTTAP